MQSPCQSLAQEFVVLTRMQELLQSERTVLKNGTFDALPDLINEKARVISEITVLAHGRHEALTAIGREASETSMQEWIGAAGSDAERQQWSQLLALAKNVKELNRLNGVLMNKHRKINQQMMSLFSGMVGNNFYGPDGQSSIKADARKFGAA